MPAATTSTRHATRPVQPRRRGHSHVRRAHSLDAAHTAVFRRESGGGRTAAWPTQSSSSLPARTRKRFRVEVRIASEPLSPDELRRREQELERLIIKAACRRAARLAELSDNGRADAEERAAIAS